ncbi:alpha/beta fold hydrolase [Guptibacillus hwajinpoensis]|uniref:alpha/beta fold hydrolase n=1 Tax=Guptibacillus hwajinpoensis TaxID=208199 RepID=UPI00273D55B1|nr:alpha/beta fold hydrolase [Pseudalkalibacillus hwajinpoensis]WLR59106.1 alpha/beta fold hydrolase [Pseudalkalibacillus hwajinpoensis]
MENLVLLPGTLCDERLFAHQKEHLTDVTASITIPDLTHQETITDLAESVLQEAPEQFALAGLSLGGIVAMEIIRIAPERITKLALLDSNPYAPTVDQLDSWKKLIQRVEGGEFQEIVQSLLPKLIHPTALTDRNLTNTIIQMAENIGPQAYIRQLKAVGTRTDARERLKSVSCPTLLLVGKEDGVCPPNFHQDMHHLLPNSSFITIKNCGYLSSLEAPEEVTSAMREWLIQDTKGGTM